MQSGFQILSARPNRSSVSGFLVKQRAWILRRLLGSTVEPVLVRGSFNEIHGVATRAFNAHGRITLIVPSRRIGVREMQYLLNGAGGLRENGVRVRADQPHGADH